MRGMKDLDIQLINSEQAERIIESGYVSGHYEPKGLYIVNSDNMWVGLDNSEGHCYVEESKDKDTIIKWLKNEIDNDSFIKLNSLANLE